MIDFDLLNNLMALYFAVGLILLICILICGLTLFVYFGMKINKLDDDNFKRRVRNAIIDKTY